MRPYLGQNVQVSRGATVSSRLTFAGHPDLGPGINPGRNLHVDPFSCRHGATPAAPQAGFCGNDTPPLTTCAGLAQAKEADIPRPLTAPPTVGTGLPSRRETLTRATTVRTGVTACDRDGGGDAARRILEANLHRILEIFATRSGTRLTFSSLPEQILKEVAEPAPLTKAEIPQIE